MQPANRKKCMHKKTLAKLQFGFEIEGAFDESIKDLVHDGDFKPDGSVDVETPRRFHTFECYGEECEECNGEGTYTEDCNCDADACDHQCSTDNGCIEIENGIEHESCTHDHESECYPCYDTDEHDRNCGNCDGNGRINAEEANEFASKIFTSLNDMQNELALFNKKNHAWDKSCGLHIHIGMKKPRNGEKPNTQFWNVMGNYDLMEQIKKESLTWCKHVKTRLLHDDNYYYKFWQNPYELVSTFNGKYRTRSFDGTPNTKFRFARFHEEYNTVEFRFLPPCEHKVENVEKLLSMVSSYLAKREIVAEEKYSKEDNDIIKDQVIINLEVREEKDTCVI